MAGVASGKWSLILCKGYCCHCCFHSFLPLPHSPLPTGPIPLASCHLPLATPHSTCHSPLHLPLPTPLTTPHSNCHSPLHLPLPTPLATPYSPLHLPLLTSPTILLSHYPSLTTCNNPILVAGIRIIAYNILVQVLWSPSSSVSRRFNADFTFSLISTLNIWTSLFSSYLSLRLHIPFWRNHGNR